jgi:hypothetical protein
MAHLFNHERHLPVPARRRLYARIATILQSNFRNRRPDAVSRAACSGPDEGIVAAQHTLYIVRCENRRPLPGATFGPDSCVASRHDRRLRSPRRNGAWGAENCRNRSRH